MESNLNNLNNLNNTEVGNVNAGVVGLNEVAVYGLRALKDVAADYTAPAGMRECKIRVKNRTDKVSQYCDLPVISDNFVQSFILNDRGMDLVRGYLESVQDDAVRSCYVEKGRSPTSADLSIDALIEIGSITSTTVRLTKETVSAWFASKMGAISHFLACKLYGEETVKTEGFWNTAEGEKAICFAANYKPHFVELSGRAPSYLPAVKQKLELVAAAVMDGSILEEKMLEKLMSAVEKTADDLGI